MIPGPVLVTGGRGQLATDLVAELTRRGVEVRAPAHAELDVTDDTAVSRALGELRPRVVFNCAAFHNVDACETNEDQAFAVNARAVARLARGCAEHQAILVHLSTNYVFDGSRAEPYREDDVPNPRSVYAISKLAGEYAALSYGPGALVARTAGLYGLSGSPSKGGNFVTRMLSRARETGRLEVVADQRLSPTFTADLAAVLVHGVETGATGVVHLTSDGDCSWHEFTVAIMDIAGVDVPVEPVETARRAGGADRPLNGVLARPGADAAGIGRLRPWREALADYMTRAGLAAAGVR